MIKSASGQPICDPGPRTNQHHLPCLPPWEPADLTKDLWLVVDQRHQPTLHDQYLRRQDVGTTCAMRNPIGKKHGIGAKPL